MDDADLNSKIDRLVNAGHEEFGADLFNAQSKFVTGMANSDPRVLREALVSIPDGHRIVAHLYDDPDEATRVLQLRGVKLASALGALSAKVADKAKPAAPATVAKKADEKPTVDMNTLPIEQYMPAREQQIKDAAKATRERVPTKTDIHDPELSEKDFATLRDEQWAAHNRKRNRQG